MNIYQSVFIFFVVVFLVVSFVSGRKTKSLQDFYVMEGGANHWLIAGTYAATHVSALGMVGLTGMSYASGPLVGILVWGAFAALPITAFFIGPPLRRFGQVTLGDFFEARFESPTIRLISSVVTVIGMGAFFVSQLVGSALITESVLGIPYNVMVPITVAVFAFIAISGGARTVTVTDTIMAAMIALLVGFLFSPAAIADIGIPNITKYAQQNPGFFTATGGGAYGWGTILGWQVLWAFGNASNPANVTRAYLAKDGRTWTIAIMIFMMFIIPVVWLSHVAAASLRVVNPNLVNPSTALIWMSMNLVSPVIGALAVAGLFAAVLSTASTQILSLSFCVSRDIYERFMVDASTREGERKILFVSRVCILIFSIIGVLGAWGRPTIITLIGNFGSSVFAAAFFPCLLMGLVWKKCTREAAITSMLTGLAVDGILSIIPLFMGQPLAWSGYLPLGIHPVIWGVVASFGALFIVSFKTKPTAKQVEVFERCQVITPEEDASTPKSMLVKYTIATGIVGVLLFAGVIWFSTKVL